MTDMTLNTEIRNEQGARADEPPKIQALRVFGLLFKVCRKSSREVQGHVFVE